MTDKNVVAQILECYFRKYSPHFLPQITYCLINLSVLGLEKNTKWLREQRGNFLLIHIMKDFESSSFFKNLI